MHAKQLEEIREEFQSTKSQLAELIADQQTQIKTQNCKMQEITDYLTGLDNAVAELQKRHPELTAEDLKQIKEPLKTAIDRINDKMTLIIDFLEKKYDFKGEKQ